MIKFNKETMSRQRFWYCLGGFFLCWLIGLVTVQVSAGSKILEAKTAYKKSSDSVQSALKKDPKTASFWDPWLEAAKVYHDHIQVVWRDAWNLQKDRITWPTSRQAPLDELWVKADSFEDWRTKFTAEPLSTDARTDIRDRLYRRQFDDFYKKIGGPDEANPKLDRMLFPVEFKGGEDGFKVMMAPTVGIATAGGIGRGGPAPAPTPAIGGPNGATGRNIDKFFNKTPTVEECWYAQEDYWVKSEVLYAVRRTLDAIGKFNREEKGFWSHVGYLVEHPDMPFTPFTAINDPPAAGRTYVPEAERRYRNSNWELHLKFEKDDAGKMFVSGNSTIRNVNSSHRVQAGSRPAAKGKNVKEPLIFRLKQKLDAGTRAPSIDFLRVKTEDLAWNKSAPFIEAKLIEENIIDPRKPFEVEQVFDWYTSPVRRIDDIKTCYHSHRDANVQLKPHPVFTKPADDAPAAAPPPVDPNAPPPQPGALPPGPVLPQPTEFNGLERNRYLNVTDTCRDLPFAVVVVVEQAYMHDFLVQAANSQLRIQITQVQLARVRNVAPTPVGDPAAGPGPVTGGLGPNRGGPATAAVEDNDPNLVEMTVYGIAALYEKFNTKKPDAPKAPGQP